MTDSGPCFAANPDISGIGVRTAIYAQNLLSFVPALLALRDGKVTHTELESLETQSMTILITAFAILVSTIIQALTPDGITNFHATIILNLSWMNNTNLSIYLLLYIQHRVNLSTEELHEEVEEMVGVKIEKVGSIIRHRWKYEIRKICSNLVVIVGSVHLSLMSAVGLWLWSNPVAFGISGQCSLNAPISVFGIQILLGSEGLKIWYILIYGPVLVPILNLIVPGIFFEGLLLIFHEFGRKWWNHWDHVVNMTSALGVLAIIDIVLLVDNEVTLRINMSQGNLGQGETMWTFGQTLALLLLLVSLRDLGESLVERRAGTLGKKLYNASRKGKIDIVQYVLDLGAKKEAVNLSIQIASDKGHLSVVEFLLKYIGDVNINSETLAHELHTAHALKLEKDQSTALYSAAMKRHLDVVKLLIEYNANVNANVHQWIAIHWAAGEGYLDIVKLLIEHDADVNAKNRDGLSALHCAAEKGHLDVVKLLLAHNADVNTKTVNQWSVLHVAATKGHLDIVSLLLEHNADVNAKRSLDGFQSTVLYFAAMKRHLDIVKLLIKHSADVEAKGDWIPLHWAAQEGHVEIVKLLVEHNAYVDAKCKSAQYTEYSAEIII
ncbi:hypothetical protein C0992_001160 [Termitomyces sp. T32_za158]|nr:hypothetical protein C0992_001160 [Termitomyces sp. T32_za158]